MNFVSWNGDKKMSYLLDMSNEAIASVNINSPVIPDIMPLTFA